MDCELLIVMCYEHKTVLCPNKSLPPRKWRVSRRGLDKSRRDSTFRHELTKDVNSAESELTASRRRTNVTREAGFSLKTRLLGTV